MGTPTAGSVVLVPFPFSDLSQAKRRPAVVLAGAGNGDWILCQVTSKSYADSGAEQLTDEDFENGGLQLVSYARPSKLFTAHESLFVFEAGKLHIESLGKIIEKVVSVIRQDF
jgi:mRNA interferase MazF